MDTCGLPEMSTLMAKVDVFLAGLSTELVLNYLISLPVVAELSTGLTFSLMNFNLATGNL